jgi:hypothetical protein
LASPLIFLLAEAMQQMPDQSRASHMKLQHQRVELPQDINETLSQLAMDICSATVIRPWKASTSFVFRIITDASEIYGGYFIIRPDGRNTQRVTTAELIRQSQSVPLPPSLQVQDSLQSRANSSTIRELAVLAITVSLHIKEISEYSPGMTSVILYTDNEPTKHKLNSCKYRTPLEFAWASVIHKALLNIPWHAEWHSRDSEYGQIADLASKHLEIIPGSKFLTKWLNKYDVTDHRSSLYWSGMTSHSWINPEKLEKWNSSIPFICVHPAVHNSYAYDVYSRMLNMKLRAVYICPAVRYLTSLFTERQEILTGCYHHHFHGHLENISYNLHFKCYFVE